VETTKETKKRNNPGILDWLVDAINSFFLTFQGLLPSILDKIFASRLTPEMEAIFVAAREEVTKRRTGPRVSRSPITPAEAFETYSEQARVDDDWYQFIVKNQMLVEMIPMVDLASGNMMTVPGVRALEARTIGTFNSEFNTAIMPLLERHWLKEYTPLLPGYQDIISIYMREGYLAEKWVEIPSEFIDFMAEQGYSSDWAKKIWGKHWVLPSVGLLYEMWHKGIIDTYHLREMLKYHDFEPVWRERLMENAFAVIPRVDLRRGFRYGLFGSEELRTRYQKLGYKWGDAEKMATIARRFSLDPYYTRMETVARAALRKGKMTETAFCDLLRSIGLPEEAVQMSLDSERIAMAAGVSEPGEEPRILSVSQILRAYQDRILDRSTAESRLQAMGFEPTDVQLLLAMSEPALARAEIHTELVTAASGLYREGLMDPAEFRGRLRQAGLTEPEIQEKVEAEELRYRLDYARDLISLCKEAYRKDVYTSQEFSWRLLSFGMVDERASALLALETLRKLPKPKVAG